MSQQGVKHVLKFIYKYTRVQIGEFDVNLSTGNILYTYGTYTAFWNRGKCKFFGTIFIFLLHIYNMMYPNLSCQRQEPEFEK